MKEHIASFLADAVAWHLIVGVASMFRSKKPGTIMHLGIMYEPAKVCHEILIKNRAPRHKCEKVWKCGCPQEVRKVTRGDQ